MGAVQLVGAVGEHEQDLRVAQAADEQRDELERRAVGPVQVLEHDQQRPVAARAGDRAEHELEQLRGLGPLARERRAVGIELGDESRELRPRVAEQRVELRGRDLVGERAQRLGQRRERHRVAAELHAAADDHAAARRRAPPRSPLRPAASCQRPPRR